MCVCDTLVLELLSWTDQHNIYPGSHDYHNRRVWTVTDLWGVAKSQQTRATRCGLDKYDALLTLLRASFSYFYGFPGVEGGGGLLCLHESRRTNIDSSGTSPRIGFRPNSFSNHLSVSWIDDCKKKKFILLTFSTSIKRSWNVSAGIKQPWPALHAVHANCTHLFRFVYPTTACGKWIIVSWDFFKRLRECTRGGPLSIRSEDGFEQTLLLSHFPLSFFLPKCLR